MKYKDYTGYTFEEINFLKELDSSTNEELEKKYDLLLHGKKLSQTEIQFLIEVIRKLHMNIKT